MFILDFYHHRIVGHELILGRGLVSDTALERLKVIEGICVLTSSSSGCKPAGGAQARSDKTWDDHT